MERSVPIEIILPAPLHQKVGPMVSNARSWKRLPERPVLGLIDNGKACAADILEAIGRHLVARGVAASHFVWRKPSAARPITSAERSDMLARAHVIVSGIGD